MEKKLKKALIYLILVFSLFSVYTSYQRTKPIIPRVTYNEFVDMMDEGVIEKAFLDTKAESFTFVTDDAKTFKVENPKHEGFKESMLKADIRVIEQSKTPASEYFSGIASLVMIVVLLSLVRSMGRGQGPQEISLENGNIPNVKFDSLVVNEDFIGEVKQFVDFLKNPQRYQDMGAKLPRGLIFYGPPGTGKTLTARAIAGEAGVPFYSVSGSDFIEKYVGVGAMRVRKLFKEARKKKNCIIFIDELDAIGGHRGSDANSEQRQTINALLSEMDGFNAHEGILVIGATNKFEDLDSALIRAGRFDRHIAIPLPETRKEREAIFNLYMKDIPVADDVRVDILARETLGFSPATIASLINDAVLVALAEDTKYVSHKHFEKAMFRRLTNGHERTNHGKMDEKDINIIAYHEAGHAVTAKLLTNQSVSKVTIMGSTSGVGGVTFILPEKMGLHSEEELIAQIRMLYGGRAAEELLHKDSIKVTSGAQNDIYRISQILKTMYNEYGMIDSKVNRNIIPFSGEKDFKRLHKFADTQYKETVKLLEENWELVSLVAEVLMEKETIYENELDEIIALKE